MKPIIGMHPSQEQQFGGLHSGDDFAGGDYLAALFAQRRLLLAVVGFFLMLAVIARFVIPEQYEGTVTMVATPSDGNLQASMNGALAGLSLLTGTSSGGEQKDVAVATLQGRTFLENFIQSQNLMPTLFANEWDGNNKRWKSRPPTLEEGYNKLSSAIAIDASPTQPIIKLRVRWKDARTAAFIANSVVKKLNSEFQAKAVSEADRMIANLTNSYPQTSIAEVRTSVANLIQEQIKRRILAKSRAEFAMTVIDPAEPSTKKVSPGLLILLPAGLFLGLLFGIPSAFLAYKLETRRSHPPQQSLVGS